MKKINFLLALFIILTNVLQSQIINGLEDGLIAYYPFNGNAHDESGNENHGIVFGATLTTDRFEVENKAYLFERDNSDWIQIDDLADEINSISAFSISIWFNTLYDPGLTYGHRLITFIDYGEGLTYENILNIGTSDLGSIHLQHFNDEQQINTGYNDGNWHLLTVNIDEAGDIFVFVDNNQISDDISWDINWSNIDRISIAQDWDNSSLSDFFDGKIDDIRIYNRVLTEEEIQILYNATHIEITAILEGSFNGIDMNTSLNPNLIPLAQPYSDPGKWNYQGTESVISIPNEDVVDWVLLELRETTGDASTAIADSMIAQKAAFLLKDGSVVDLDGESPVYFSNDITDNLFVIVYHRNHLPVMSSQALTMVNGGYSWDFTTPEGQAFGEEAQKNLGDIYGLYGGDSDANGIINMNDKDLDWVSEVGKQGAFSSDLNMNGEVNNVDKNDIWEPNRNLESQIPEIIANCGYQISDVDGNFYYTVQFGNQCWMKENLKTTTYANGTPIPNVTDNSAWSNLSSGAFVWYENNISWKDSYGALYNWFATVDTSGLCPTGWHVPSDDEWTALSDFIGGGDPPHGNELKSCRQINSPLGGDCDTMEHPRWDEDTNNGNFGTDDYGFAGLPGGSRSSDGTFGYIGAYGLWLTSTATSPYSAYCRAMHTGYGGFGVSNNSNQDGFSVRCIRD